MQTPKSQRKRAGQALVEFALSATLLFFILTAIIDFGLAFFAYQGIVGAAQEGASYASFKPTTSAGGVPTLNDTEIRQRVRFESGIDDATIQNRARFVNLFDLDNKNGVDSVGVQEAYILISTVPNPSNILDSNGVPVVTCSNSPDARKPNYCDMAVEVLYDYKPFFAASGLLGMDTIRLHAKRQMTIGR
jgi:hypothetical protein